MSDWIENVTDEHGVVNYDAIQAEWDARASRYARYPNADGRAMLDMLLQAVHETTNTRRSLRYIGARAEEMTRLYPENIEVRELARLARCELARVLPAQGETEGAEQVGAAPSPRLAPTSGLAS